MTPEHDSGYRIPAGGPVTVEIDAMKRQIAEARMKLQSTFLNENMETMPAEEIRHLLHELGVHQIELEMQNEELRESQIALDTVRERFFDLYDLAPVGYFALSEHGLICQANLCAAHLFGVPRSALHMQPLSKFILTEDQDLYYLHRKRLLEDGVLQSFELRLQQTDGSTFWVHLSMTAAHDAEGAIELRVVLTNINERMLLQQALISKNAELERALAVADQASQAKSEFLSRMSHELRTPLHAILGFGQLLAVNASDESVPMSDQQSQSVDQILKAGWHLLALINEVLDLAVIESGTIGLSMEPIALEEIFSDCKDMILPLIQQHDIRVNFPATQMPYVVLADRIRLKQALINLLSNAIKYNQPGGAVSISCCVMQNQCVRINVADTGQGMSHYQLSQLFQPFNRLGQELSGTEGAGIGLVVCKKLIDLMQGEIGASSTEGKGSVFWIELRQVG